MSVRKHACISTSSSSSADLSPKRHRFQEEEIMADFEEKMESDIENIIHTALDEKLATFKDDLKKELTLIVSRKVANLQKRVLELEKKHTEKDAIINDLQERLDRVERHAILNEQYSRRENLRILGLAEKDGETCAATVLNFCHQTLKVDLKPEDIAIAHRLPTRGEKAKPIIVRFSSRAARDRTIRNRRVLKGSGISVVEDLCQAIQTQLREVKDDRRIAVAWTWHGKVIAKLKGRNGSIVPVDYGKLLTSVILERKLPLDDAESEAD